MMSEIVNITLTQLLYILISIPNVQITEASILKKTYLGITVYSTQLNKPWLSIIFEHVQREREREYRSPLQSWMPFRVMIVSSRNSAASMAVL